MAPRNSVRDRRICFDSHKFEVCGRVMLRCHICGGNIDPVKEKWHADHVIRHAEGGTAEDTMPAHPACHQEKTKDDVSTIAHGKRMSDRHYGIKKPKGWYRPAGAKFDWSSGRYRKSDDQ